MVADPNELSLLQKYSIIRQFMVDDSQAQAVNQSNVLSEEEIVEIDGKIYKRVQIENQD